MKHYAVRLIPFLLTTMAAVFVPADPARCADAPKPDVALPVTLKESVAHLMRIHDRIKAAESNLNTSEPI